MMEVQKISEETTISDSESVAAAMKRMKDVPEHELQFYLVLKETLNATAAQTRAAITLAQVESDRRANRRTFWLTVSSTVLSGVIGLLGVGLGAYLAR